MVMPDTAFVTTMETPAALHDLAGFELGVGLGVCIALVLTLMWLWCTSKISSIFPTSVTSSDMAFCKSGDSRVKRLCSDKLLASARQAACQGVEQAAPGGDSAATAALPCPALTCQPLASAAAPAPATPTAILKTSRKPNDASSSSPRKPAFGSSVRKPAFGSSVCKPATPNSSPNKPAFGGSSPHKPAFGGSSPLKPAFGGSSPLKPATPSSSPRNLAFGSSSPRQPINPTSLLATSTVLKQLPNKSATSAPCSNSSSSSSRAAPTAPRPAAAPAAPLKARTPCRAPTPVTAAKQQQRQPSQAGTPKAATPAAPTTPTAAAQPRRTCHCASAAVELRVTDSAEMWLNGTFEAEAPCVSAAAKPSSPVDWRTNPLCSEALEL